MREMRTLPWKPGDSFNLWFITLLRFVTPNPSFCLHKHYYILHCKRKQPFPAQLFVLLLIVNAFLGTKIKD